MYQGKIFQFRLNPENGTEEKQLFDRLNSLGSGERSDFIRSLMVQAWIIRSNFK